MKDLIANPSEVDQIFSAPLDYFGNTESLIHKEVDLIWLAGTNYKLHQFHHASFPKMVSGLTADILMTTVLIGAGLSEAEEEAEEGSWDGNVGRFKFKRRAEGQMTWSETVKVALRSDKDAFQSRAL